MGQFSTAVSELRSSSRSWWWHAKLRDSKQHSEARKAEIRSVRNEIRNFREGKLAVVGLAGVIIQGVSAHSSSWQVSGLPSDYGRTLRTWAPHIPFVDKRSISEDNLFCYVVRCPLITVTGSVCSPGYLTIGAYCAVWERLGATVHWGNVSRAEWIDHPHVLATVAEMQG